METRSVTLTTLEELAEEAARLVRERIPVSEKATLVTLSGELGAGKTTFAQQLARELGVSETVTSPTFVLAKTYDLIDHAFTRLVHIDAYRLTDAGGLASIRFDEYYADPENLILLEWPEMVRSELPKANVAITLEVREDGTRHITYA